MLQATLQATLQAVLPPIILGVFSIITTILGCVLNKSAITQATIHPIFLPEKRLSAAQIVPQLKISRILISAGILQTYASGVAAVSNTIVIFFLKMHLNIDKLSYDQLHHMLIPSAFFAGLFVYIVGFIWLGIQANRLLRWHLLIYVAIVVLIMKYVIYWREHLPWWFLIAPVQLLLAVVIGDVIRRTLKQPGDKRP